MNSTEFEYDISRLLYSSSPFSVKLTCMEVRCTKIICHSNNKTSDLPDQTIIHHSNFIPLTTPNRVTAISRPTKRSRTSTTNISLNFASFSEALHSFGFSDHSTLLGQVEQAITSSSLRGRGKGKGVVEVNIWKIISNVYEIDHVKEKLVIESLLAKKTIGVFKYDSTAEEENAECVICIEDYTQGSLMAKLACDHAFHGVCINKWLDINHHCPMCRFPISR